MPDSLNITVEPGTEPIRLDVFLATHIDKSRSQVQKLIKAGGVMVNGKTHDPHDLIRPGDVIVYNDDTATIRPKAVITPEPLPYT